MNDPERPRDEALEQRIQALEERLAYQQRLLEELNEVVLEQRGELDRLSRQAVASRATIEQLLAQGEDLPHEKPPHY
jgi:SlyX protein